MAEKKKRLPDCFAQLETVFPMGKMVCEIHRKHALPACIKQNA
jgi:hypothetical protein